jgi:hypothetical protein
LFLTSAQHGFENLHIPGAAAQISRQSVSNVCLGWFWISFQQIDGRQYHPGSADAALRAAAINEGLLNSVQLIASRNAFDSLNRGAFNLSDWNQATVNDPAIDNDAARATLTFAATFLSSRELQLLTQYVEQTLHRVSFNAAHRSVDGKTYIQFFTG